MSVEPGERRSLGLATGAGGVAACAACCAPPVIGLLGLGTGLVAVLSAALFAGLLVAVVVAVALTAVQLRRRRVVE
jgi:high-affinity K+ transport system ATPase subunit B